LIEETLQFTSREDPIGTGDLPAMT
jgi:hypothetical protein